MAKATADVREVSLPTRSFEELRGALRPAAWERLQDACDHARKVLAGRTVWTISSTDRGGGVAEMMRTLLPYSRGAGVDSRWLVLDGPPEFFGLTKRLHNLLHGLDVRPLGPHDRDLFRGVARAAAAQAIEAIRPGDVVLLHDPQTAGLVAALRDAGAPIVWRCHVGADEPSDAAEAAWRFLVTEVQPADVVVFVRAPFVPAALRGHRVRLIAPAIDPSSAKNQPLVPPRAHAILDYCGLAQAARRAGPSRVAVPGRMAHIRRRCRVLHEGPLPRLGHDRLVVALARWDRLKDPAGIMLGFTQVTDPDARLILAGPAVGAIADDPEGGQVLGETRAVWEHLPDTERRRIVVATLPMADLDENALIVNALQREAAVIVKKSLQEGFGLGVTEGLWKARPVVATRVGGHQEQIEHRRSGLLIDDPTDRTAFAAAIDELLADPAAALALATAGRERVRDRFLADRHFIAWTRTLSDLVAASS